VFNQISTPPIGASSALKIVKNGIESRKLWAFKKTTKKPPNATKANSQTPTNFLICCFVVVIIQRQFVEL
jgi:hypothetical protein